MTEQHCPFCDIHDDRIIAQNDLAYAVRDAFPVARGHTLLVPHRHVADWWATMPDERAAIDVLCDQMKAHLDAELHPDGYNLGINNGAAAGQTVAHTHVHLIPRFHGDTPNPRGGVRHVIAERAGYPADGIA